MNVYIRESVRVSPTEVWIVSAREREREREPSETEYEKERERKKEKEVKEERTYLMV